LGSDTKADAFRLSLAGAHEKTAFLQHKGVWCLPKGVTPTTHIFKLPIGTTVQGIDLTTSVETEWLCSRLVAAMHVPVAPCSIETFGSYKVLIVERFDRRLALDAQYWLRLPQEDFCQVTGLPSDKKYQHHGGPGILKIMELLAGSDEAQTDRTDFFRTQVISWLLAGIDGHAKNFSVFLLPGGAFRLTPRYDILSAHPLNGTGPGQVISRRVKMAMAVAGKNNHYRWDEILGCHWLATARRVGIPDAKALIEQIIAEVGPAVERVQNQLPGGFPDALAGSIFSGMKAAANKLSQELVVLPIEVCADIT
jgi:serine/threonine-protein kinase HipA